MSSAEANAPRPTDVLAADARGRYGAERAHELRDQIALLGTSIAAIRAYPLAPEVEPWSGLSVEEPTSEAGAV